MNKKILALCLCLLLTGCSLSDSDDSKTTTQKAENSTSSSQTAEAGTSAPQISETEKTDDSSEAAEFPEIGKKYSNTSTINNKNSVPTMFCFNGNTVYFSLNGALCSYDENTKKTEKLIDINAYNLNYFDGRLYFLENKNEYFKDRLSQYISGTPYELDLSDMTLTKLSDIEVNDLIVNADGIFYTSYSFAGDELPSGVYMLDKDSGNEYRLYNGTQYNCYDNKWISFENDGEYKKILFNNEEATVLCRGEVPQKDCISGDNYYYISAANGTLNRVSLESGEKTANVRLSDEELAADPERETLLTALDYTVFKDELYFTNEDYSLCRYDEEKGIIRYEGTDSLQYLYSTDEAMYAVKTVFSDDIHSVTPYLARLIISGDTVKTEVIS